MVYYWSDEEKEAVFGSRKLSPDNLDCKFYYPCRLMIVNEPVLGESLEIASRNLQKDGLKLFCDKIIQSSENIPVALSDQGSSELMDIITKINYAMEHFENPQILCNGFVYVKPKTAKFTFVQMMDTERYLLKLMASSALREGILKHLTTLHKFMSNPACEFFPQLTLDLDLIEVQEGKCFKISQRKFIDRPFTQKDFRKISPRMFIPYDSTSPPEPKYFKDAILNSFPDDDVRVNFLNKFYQCLMA